MAKSTSKRKPVVMDSVEDLADAGLQKKAVLGSDKSSIEFTGTHTAEDIQQRAERFVADNVIAWDVTEYYKRMSVQLMVLKGRIIYKLRNHESATTELHECEELMYTCLNLANKHKYTYPSWRRELASLDYNLVALAEVNEMLGKHEWPTDSDGRPVKLSTYLESILWY